MSAELPPPGAERDAEIARLLNNVQYFSGPMGWFYVYPEDYGGYRSANHFGRPSTDPAACDRLERELSARGFSVMTNRWPLRSVYPGQVDASVIPGFNNDRACCVTAETRPAAVSAAALLALRGAR